MHLFTPIAAFTLLVFARSALSTPTPSLLARGAGKQTLTSLRRTIVLSRSSGECSPGFDQGTMVCTPDPRVVCEVGNCYECTSCERCSFGSSSQDPGCVQGPVYISMGPCSCPSTAG